MRILLVDDDPGLLELLRATFEAVDVELDAADSAPTALASLARSVPDVAVVDVNMPGTDGIALCRAIKSSPATARVAVLVLTGSAGERRAEAEAAGADAFVLKPFSPLELLAAVERLAGGLHAVPFRAEKNATSEQQLQLYARDLRHLLEIERQQRRRLEDAYRETVSAFAAALESKDFGTRAHSQRVQRYAGELALCVDRELAADPSVEYGFLLHDVGKIRIPDEILRKPGPLDEGEQRLMRTHTVVGEQMLAGIAVLDGRGLEVVRSHHERWDGSGYPDRLKGEEIPLGARVFAVADALDAMTSDRPYHAARPWTAARAEIQRQAGRQFDPRVVEAFRDIEDALLETHRQFLAA
jgi:response regulator RpfG family c-di-GMP phosphodiesterase